MRAGTSQGGLRICDTFSNTRHLGERLDVLRVDVGRRPDAPECQLAGEDQRPLTVKYQGGRIPARPPVMLPGHRLFDTDGRRVGGRLNRDASLEVFDLNEFDRHRCLPDSPAPARSRQPRLLLADAKLPQFRPGSCHVHRRDRAGKGGRRMTDSIGIGLRGETHGRFH